MKKIISIFFFLSPFALSAQVDSSASLGTSKTNNSCCDCYSTLYEYESACPQLRRRSYVYPFRYEPNNQMKNTISYLPFSVIVDGYDVSFERALGKKSAIHLTGGFYQATDPARYTNAPSNRMTVEEASFTGFRTEIQFRNYLISDWGYTNGLYVGLFSNLRQYSFVYRGYITKQSPDLVDIKYQVSSLGNGFLFGYKFITKSRINFDFSTGSQLVLPLKGSTIELSEADNGFAEPFERKTTLRLLFTVGYSF